MSCKEFHGDWTLNEKQVEILTMSSLSFSKVSCILTMTSWDWQIRECNYIFLFCYIRPSKLFKIIYGNLPWVYLSFRIYWLKCISKLKGNVGVAFNTKFEIYYYFVHIDNGTVTLKSDFKWANLALIIVFYVVLILRFWLPFVFIIILWCFWYSTCNLILWVQDVLGCLLILILL
jgi:hypothetical protein